MKTTRKRKPVRAGRRARKATTAQFLQDNAGSALRRSRETIGRAYGWAQEAAEGHLRMPRRSDISQLTDANPLLLGAVGLGLGVALPLGVSDLASAPLAGLVFAAIGYMAPSLWLEQRIGQRRRQIQRSLAEATDLLTLVVESGMSLDEGLLSITERFHNALGDEIGKVLREIRLGRPRMSALEHMADAAGVPDLHHLVESIVQSDQMGVPIARLLRVQATEMRRRQRQGAQERAAQASSRMVFPMVGCIFPVLWVVLLGPAVIQVLKSLK